VKTVPIQSEFFCSHDGTVVTAAALPRRLWNASSRPAGNADPPTCPPTHRRGHTKRLRFPAWVDKEILKVGNETREFPTVGERAFASNGITSVSTDSFQVTDEKGAFFVLHSLIFSAQCRTVPPHGRQNIRLHGSAAISVCSHVIVPERPIPPSPSVSHYASSPRWAPMPMLSSGVQSQQSPRRLMGPKCIRRCCCWSRNK